MSKRKIAKLQGEQLLQFRTGSDMYPYCNDCQNSVISPISGVRGCSEGDNPQVIEYSDAVNSGQVDIDADKCPGFISKLASTPGEGAPIQASHLTAGFDKDIPAVNTRTDDDWQDLLELSLNEVEDENPDAATVIDYAVKELTDRDKKSQQDPDRYYNYAIPSEEWESLVEKTRGHRHIQSSTVSNPEEKDAFLTHLASCGLTKDTPDGPALELIATQLLDWNDGVMATQINDKLMRSILSDYRLKAK